MKGDPNGPREGGNETAATVIEAAALFREPAEAAVRRLAALAPLDYDRVRQAEAEALAVRVGTLDQEVARARPADGKREAGQGAEVQFAEPAPWPDPVDGAALLAALAAELRRYVSAPEAALDGIALWVMHAHCHEAADVSPVLAITSPEKRCGKTTTLSIVATLVPRALNTANVTPAALFRSVEKWRPTLLIDEADTFLRSSDDLRGILNSGHARQSASILRTVGDEHEPRAFTTWSPKVIALIGRLPGTLTDRSIEVRLQRKLPGEPAIERFRPRRSEALLALHRQAARWATDHLAALIDADPAMPPALHDRAADNWRQLLAVADLAGGEWPERARRAAVALSGGEAAEDTSRAAMLLADIKALFDERGASRLESAEIVRALGEMEHRPWPEWKAGKPMTAVQLARVLAPFGVRSSNMRAGAAGGVAKGYQRADFETLWARYAPVASDGVDRSATRRSPSEDNGLRGNRSATGSGDVADQNARNPLVKHDDGGVADQTAQSGARGGIGGAEPERTKGPWGEYL